MSMKNSSDSFFMACTLNTWLDCDFITCLLAQCNRHSLCVTSDKIENFLEAIVVSVAIQVKAIILIRNIHTYS